MNARPSLLSMTIPAAVSFAFAVGWFLAESTADDGPLTRAWLSFVFSMAGSLLN